jgi:hypothetical protein
MTVKQQARFFNVAREDAIDMSHLNGGSSSNFVRHLAEVQPSLRNYMMELLPTMKTYYIELRYWCRMSRPSNVRFFFFFFLPL